MKGMVFAAGLGTRLRPLTDSVPKALVALGGVPMLQRVLLRMKSAGIDEVVVNVHHFADKVKEFLARNDNFGMRIHVSDESALLLDTGGGVAAAARWFAGDEPILLHNADIFTDIDFADMARVHAASGADATLLVAPRTTSRYLLFDSAMRMHGWTDLRTGAVRPAELASLAAFAGGATEADSVAVKPFLIKSDDVTSDNCTDVLGTAVAVDSLNRYAFGGVHIISPALLSDLIRYATTLKQDDCSASGNRIDSDNCASGSGADGGDCHASGSSADGDNCTSGSGADGGDCHASGSCADGDNCTSGSSVNGGNCSTSGGRVADVDCVPFSITNYYIDVCNRLRIFGYIQPSATRWHDVGTLDKLRAATASLRPSDY
jgi:CTP:molybdopterin cytidylyltransferase MocA